MKYYYISHEGPFRNNLIIGKDLDRVVRDKNKIIITRINGSFHVLICRNGSFLKEKLVLSYFELISFLKKNSFNTYFINVNSETAYYIHSYVKKDEIYKDTKEIVEKPKSFFTISEDKLLKVEAFVERDILKEKIVNVYNEDSKNDDKMQIVNLFDFIENSELFELYHLPFNEKNGKFTIPNYSYAKPSLFYILSGIYNKDGDKINLTSDDLVNLYFARIMDNDITEDILNSIELNVTESYDLNEFNKSIDFIYLYKKQENDIYIKLKTMKNKLEEAKRNQQVINALGLLENVKSKNLEKVGDR